jgi:aryl carrier-like protein
MFENDEVLDRMRFIDFYRYCDDRSTRFWSTWQGATPWIRPSDTGRSTNCLINQAGIFVHQTERGFHNYAMPYSWDVRLGHKGVTRRWRSSTTSWTRGEIRTMLDRVGYRERPSPPAESRLVAYYTAEREIPAADLRRFLEVSLPAEMMPSTFVRLDQLPSLPAGRSIAARFRKPDAHRPVLRSAIVAPRTPVEALLADAWTEVLGLHPIGVHDDFFELGGDSMQCIQIVSAARVRGLSFAPRDVFAHPTIAELALIARRESTAAPVSATATAQELSELLADFGD